MTIKNLKNEEPEKEDQAQSASSVPPISDDGLTEQVHFTRVEDMTTRVIKAGDVKRSEELEESDIVDDATVVSAVVQDDSPAVVINNMPDSPPTYIPPPPGTTDPLPRKVDLVDLGATQVTSTALPSLLSTRPSNPVQSPPDGGGSSPGQPPSGKKRDTKGCFLKLIIAFLFLMVLGIVLAGAFLVYQYYTIAATLPSVEDMRERASQFETTRFYDRNGDMLYEMIDPNAGRRTYIPIEEVSPYVIAATISIEDKEFYNHPGFDAVALARALVTNYLSGEVVSGASTITQQLARGLFMEEAERTEISYRRKAREIILSAELTRRYSKNEILEMYLNEFNYGNLAYGIEAAAETYFNTTADQLDMAQAAFLAGLPQAPGIYDIFTNREATLFRNKQVVTAMY